MAITTILVFSLFCLSALTPASAEEPFTLPRCDNRDKKALLAIKRSFNDAYHFASWTPEAHCCEWYGVQCDPNSARVVYLYIITDGNLTGVIPPEISELPELTSLTLHKLPKLVGNIPSTITKLKKLSTLQLSWNSLSGPIPSFLSQITSLTVLDLSFNKFSGTIPASLSSLPNLAALHLDRNQLTGTIPESFGNFKNPPPDLYLSLNNLSGAIPASLGIPNWRTIDLSRNQFTGDASFLFGLTKPTFDIDLSRNQFMFNLSKVQFPANSTSLDFNHNMLYGSIPVQINQLAQLGSFNVSYNQLCGEIPAGEVTAKFDQFSFAHNKCLCGKPLAPCS